MEPQKIKNNKKNPIIVYWSPATFYPEEESWNLLYQEPQSVSKSFYNSLKKGSSSLSCPASRDFLHNVFSLDSTITNNFNFPKGLLSDIYYSNKINFSLPVESSVEIKKIRENQLEGYVNLEYNNGWFFLAEEDLTMKLSAPFFPAMSPIEGSMLASGSYNIGKWFRSINLEYYVPIDAKSFNVKKNDPVAFLQFETERQIIFKRFVLNKKIGNIADELVAAKNYYKFIKNLKDRYSMFDQSKIKNLLLKEIKESLV